MVRFTVNGQRLEFSGDETMPLLWYLRDFAGFKGAKFGCGAALCGACTVHVDGAAVRACVRPVGSVDGADMVASLWRPDDSLAAPDGLVAGEHVWAALDCPSCFAFRRPDLRVLLGSLTAVVHRRPTPRETYVVVAWPERSEGRKHFSAAALLDAEGEVMARAQALWIELKPEAIAAMKAGG